MANIQISTSLNMYTTQVVYGYVVTYDASHIVISAGSLESIYTGNFTYSSAGEVFGVLTGYTSLANGVQQAAVSGLNVSANDAMHLIQANLLQTFYQIALAGNDQFAVTTGTHLLDGYAGYNTITEMLAHANYTISSSNGATIVSSTLQNDTLYNFQKVYFADGYYDPFSHSFAFSAMTGTFVGSASVTDTVVVPDLFRQNQLIGSPSGSATLSGPAISDSLFAIDRLQFVDGTMYSHVRHFKQQARKFYRSCLELFNVAAPG